MLEAVQLSIAVSHHRSVSTVGLGLRLLNSRVVRQPDSTQPVYDT